MSTSQANVEPLYWKTWALLVLLMSLSVASYFSGSRPLAIFTSMTIALVCTIVATTIFMHLTTEPRFIVYLCAVALAVMGVFFFLVSPDVMRHSGQNWVNVAAHQEIQRVEAAQAAHPGGN